jgi:arylsulfatase A-like enzyme
MNKMKQLVMTGLALACMTLLACSTAAERNNPVNVLFILADDLGWSDLGCYGSTFYETPNIDRLAAQGMRFTDAYAACAVCSPTRASIMTGKYPARTDTTDWFRASQPNEYRQNTILRPAPSKNVMALEEKTIAETMKENGYATFFAGKWHLGHKGFWPEDQGFDVNKGGHTSGGPYTGNKYFSPYDNPRIENGPDGEHLPDRLASETGQFMAAHRNEPFFAYLSFYSVHTPLMARKDLEEKYEEKKARVAPETRWKKEGDSKTRLVQNHAVYAGMIEGMDLAVGKVLKKLSELGLEKNTVVIFMSDNGGVSTHGSRKNSNLITSNMPLRGGKDGFMMGVFESL